MKKKKHNKHALGKMSEPFCVDILFRAHNTFKQQQCFRDKHVNISGL